jgi:hypothetical protein
MDDDGFTIDCTQVCLHSTSHMDLWSIVVVFTLLIQLMLMFLYAAIRALSAASAAKYNIAPVRWQHPLHVAIVPTESKGKTEGNNWDTACGNFKT